MFSTTSAQPISPKLLKGLGCCPTSFCTSGYRCALLAGMARAPVWVLTGFACYSARKSRSYHAGFRKCSYTCCACYSPFSMLASVISLNGNRRQPPPCLPKSETDGRRQWRRSRSSRSLTASVRFATQIMILNEAKEAGRSESERERR